MHAFTRYVHNGCKIIKHFLTPPISSGPASQVRGQKMYAVMISISFPNLADHGAQQVQEDKNNEISDQSVILKIRNKILPIRGYNSSVYQKISHTRVP